MRSNGYVFYSAIPIKKITWTSRNKNRILNKWKRVHKSDRENCLNEFISVLAQILDSRGVLSLSLSHIEGIGVIMGKSTEFN